MATAKCFEIAIKVWKTWFVVGYCPNLRLEENLVVLESPFTRANYQSDLGAVACRGKWPHGLRVSAAAFGFFPTPWMPWMDLSFEDIAAVDGDCRRYSRSLKKSGFRRMT